MAGSTQTTLERIMWSASEKCLVRCEDGAHINATPIDNPLVILRASPFQELSQEDVQGSVAALVREGRGKFGEALLSVNAYTVNDLAPILGGYLGEDSRFVNGGEMTSGYGVNAVQLYRIEE